ncbi:MAG: CoA-binding protein [Aminivibrio sp.]
MNKEEILKKLVCKPCRVAVVGASPKADRPVFRVMNYLAGTGFALFPVNPAYAGTEVAGRVCAPDLESLAEPVDVVALFLAADRQGAVAQALEKITPKPVVWFQPGAENPSLASELAGKGYDVVPSACLMADHMNLCR